MKRTESDHRLNDLLESTHAKVNAEHDAARERLLAATRHTTHDVSVPSNWKAWITGLGSSVAALVLVMIWFSSYASPATAMERLAKALAEISSYSYRMESTHVSTEGAGRTVRQVTTGRWQTQPLNLYAEILMQEMQGTAVGAGTVTPDTVTPDTAAPDTIVLLEEAHGANRPGILIDHIKHEYWYVDEPLDANAIPPGSPQVAVYMVQQRRGRVLRDLGQATIDGRNARGIEFVLDASQPSSELGAATDDDGGHPELWLWRDVKFEVWIDPNTDLPIEFRCVRQAEGSETSYRFSDLQWNVAFAEQDFDIAPPADYSERP